jgi:hypothetical protein|tara:strand:- start:2181 stop:2678 length:498 start_codon:yes stop_codon:yes gene_type:complete
MTNSELQSKSKAELSKDFRTTVTNLETSLISLADGENIIAGTKEDPIVTDSSVIPIRHFFMDGVYVREMTMKAGMAVIGAIHKHLHMCFLLTGKILVANEEETTEHVAPCFIISTPGIKRVLYAEEDSVWYNTHKNPTNTEDVKKLEKDLVSISYEEYEEYIKNK